MVFAVKYPARIRSGVPVPVRLMLPSANAATPAKRARPLAQVPVFGHAELRERLLVPVAPDHRQPLGTLIRQRPEEHAVDHAEDRGVGADAEREGEHRHEREARPLPQAPEGVPEVLAEAGHSDLSDVIGSSRTARRAGT